VTVGPALNLSVTTAEKRRSPRGCIVGVVPGKAEMKNPSSSLKKLFLRVYICKFKAQF